MLFNAYTTVYVPAFVALCVLLAVTTLAPLGVVIPHACDEPVYDFSAGELGIVTLAGFIVNVIDLLPV